MQGCTESTSEFSNIAFTLCREGHQCPECPENFTFIQNLKRHQRSRHEAVRFPCEFCGKTLSRIDVLKKHQEICGGKANLSMPDGWVLLPTDRKSDEGNQCEADAARADDMRTRNKSKKAKLAPASEPAMKWEILSNDEGNASHWETDAVEPVGAEHRNTNDKNGNVVKQEQENSLAIFCTKCGARFTDDEDMFCRKCGTPRKSL